MRTELVTLDGASDLVKIAHAADVLRAGGLVAFPTETVYGIGADANNPEALARLARVKGKLDGKNYALLLGSLRQAQQLTGGLPRTGAKLARLYWPGPLTLVAPRASGGKIGLRLPEHPVARRLLAQCGFPLAVPSAKLRGKSDGLTAEQVRKAFDGQIALVLEGHPPPKGLPSTVVEVTDLGANVLREGSVSELDVLESAAPSVLFVCTGNTCRSPMAEALGRAALLRTARLDTLPLRVNSAGTNANQGEPAHMLAFQALRETGIDISNHRATLLTPDLVDSADWIFTMTRTHRDAILEFMPQAAERVHLLSEYDEDIEEPGGRSLQRYRECRDAIAKSMGKVVAIVEEVGG